MILDVKHLRLVLAIAERGTVSAAARHVYLTQSALSHQLIDLERRIGTVLFHRTGRRMVATDAGTRIVETAKRVLDDVLAAEADVLRPYPRADTTLRVGTDAPAALVWLPRVLDAAAVRLPHLLAEVVPRIVDHAAAALIRGSVGLVVARDLSDDPRLSIVPLFREELVAVLSRSHRLAERAEIKPGDLEIEDVFTHPADAADRRPLAQLLRDAGLAPKRLTETPLSEAIVALATSGRGIGILPQWMAAESATLRVLRLSALGIHREWFAAALKSGASSLHVKCLASVARDVMRGPAAPFAGGSELRRTPLPDCDTLPQREVVRTPRWATRAKAR